MIGGGVDPFAAVRRSVVAIVRPAGQTQNPSLATALAPESVPRESTGEVAGIVAVAVAVVAFVLWNEHLRKQQAARPAPSYRRY